MCGLRADGPDEVDDRGDDKSQIVYRSSPTEWFLLTGNRAIVASGILVGAFGVLFGLLLADVIAVADGGPLSRTFAAVIGGNLTLLTIVVSINQLILAREFGTPDELYEQVEEIIDYRREVEETADIDVSPVTPDAFLDFLMRVTRDHAREMRDAPEERAPDTPTDVPDGRIDSGVDELVETLVAQSERVSGELEQSSADAFSTLITILDVDFTRDLQQARGLRNSYGEDLSAERLETLDEIIKLIEFTGVMRQYLETLYMQRELTGLSRKLLYTGIPAIVVSLSAAWIYGLPAGPTLGGPTLEIVIPAAAAVGLAPLAVFFAYIVRIATIARRTASLMPFDIGESDLG